MTPRKLMNKKAYDEILLLERRCAMETNMNMKPSLCLDLNMREMFKIQVMSSTGKKIIRELYGKNYTEIEKALTRYIDDFKNGNL